MTPYDRRIGLLRAELDDTKAKAAMGFLDTWQKAVDTGAMSWDPELGRWTITSEALFAIGLSLPHGA